MKRKTDRNWERIGESDPYYGVLTEEKFRSANLTEELKEEFFKTGTDHITHVVSRIRQHLDPSYEVHSALDFGCGTGRLVVPLAAIAENVTGVDISEAMLEEARINCESRSLKNVALAKSDDKLSMVSGRFNFIHSIVVFQHIPVSRGEKIFERLLELLEPGGVCVVHFTYGKDSRARKLKELIRKYVPFAQGVRNILNGNKFLEPQMQMNDYNLNRIFFAIQSNLRTSYSYVEYVNHDGALGLIVYCRK
jgi:cyclopropane fatty-acyl-phospholipid synthase-like methyltransferase